MAAGNVRVEGWFRAQLLGAPDGRGRRKLLWGGVVKNAPVDDGLTDLASVFANQGTQRAWCFGLISGASFSAVASTDTMASHPGWTEFTGYQEAARPAWNVADPATPTVSYASLSQFTFNATGAVRGVLVSSSNTKGGTSGILWATGLRSENLSVSPGQLLTVGYSVRFVGGEAE
jgi:hypothetical protein